MRDYRTIAVDFDGTLCAHEYPNIGKSNDILVSEMIKQRKKGNKLILWTCRTGDLLAEAVAWCAQKGLIFDAVNENLPETIALMGGDSRKIWADEYVDDRASIPAWWTD